MEDILQHLPHRPPFVMIDDIATGEKSAKATFVIMPDNVLAEDGFFSESGLIENMAQAAGAGLPHAPGSTPSVGYIGAIKDLRIEQLPAVGAAIVTEVGYMHQVMNAHIVQAKVSGQDGQLLASCELKIFLQS